MMIGNSIDKTEISNSSLGDIPSKSQHVSKVTALFQHKAIPAQSLSAKEKPTLQNKIKELMGISTGSGLSVLGVTTGATVGLHEVVGHGMLGIELTTKDSNPQYQVTGWDKFNDMTHSSSAGEGIANFFKWISSDGSGVTSHSSSAEPNKIGQAMGPSGQDAWISVAGSLPALGLDSLSVISGVHLRKRSPIIGNMLLSFGLMDNMLNSGYPISAALMNHAQMEEQASHGHDFANFSLRMSEVSGLPAKDIAISTAVFWTGFVPLIAILAYLHSKSHIKDVVPNVLALKNWIQKAENDPKIADELENLYQMYPNKDRLEKANQKNLFSNHDFINFIEYLLEKVPVKDLDVSKNEILKAWDKNIPKDKVQTALTGAAVLGLAAAVTSKVLALLALIKPSLQTAATTLGYITPIFILASVLSSAYQVYKDFKCPDGIVPKNAKMLSVANLVMTVVCSTLIVSSFFIPGLNLIFIGALVIGCISSIAISYIRSQIIRNKFTLSKSLEPEVWNYMFPLWHKNQEERVPMKRSLKCWTYRVSKEKNLYSYLAPLEMYKILHKSS
jgi:hypothetical protein